MTTDLKLYSLNYDEVRTYGISALFVAANIALPQLFHLIPQGGIIFAPLSLVILFGACKFGWKSALLAAVASPLVNHQLFGLPAVSVMALMTLKLALLALLAGVAIQRFRTVTIPMLIGVVLATEAVGGMAELLFTGGMATTMADFTLGWPGLLLQVFGTYGLLKIGSRM